MTARWQRISSHFGKVFGRQGQSRNSARVDMKCRLLTEFFGPRFADQQVLTRALRALVVDLRGRVKDERKVCTAYTAGRSTQDNMR